MTTTPFSLESLDSSKSPISWSERLIWSAAFLSFVIGSCVAGYGGYQLWLYQNQHIDPITCLEGESLSTFHVDVSGAVKQPGIYTLPHGSRVGDALAAAGGVSVEADAQFVHQSLNLAHNVTDGQKVYIPTRSEQVKSDSSSVTEQEIASSGGERESIESGPSTGISINHATAAQLETLSGIGPARAQSIINARPFSDVSELLEQKIVPSNIFEEISSKIVL